MIILFFCNTIPTLSAEAPQTNLQLLRTLYDDLFAGAFVGISFSDSVSILIHTNEDVAYKWLIEERLVDKLRSFHVNNIFIDKAAEPFEIEVRPIEQSISYSKHKAKLRRQVNVELYLHIKDANNKLLFSNTLKRTRSDTIKTADVKRVENLELSFTRGAQRRSFLGKIAEPVVVSLVTGFVIYLFYSYRSK